MQVNKGRCPKNREGGWGLKYGRRHTVEKIIWGVFFVILGEAVKIISENYSLSGRGYANNPSDLGGCTARSVYKVTSFRHPPSPRDLLGTFW